MRKKLLGLVIAVVFISIPIAIAAVTYQQNVTFSGSRNYPTLGPIPTGSPAPTATPTPGQTVKFSLYFQNGTACPTTFSNLPITVADYSTSKYNVPYAMLFVVKNDGSVPINLSVTTANVNIPSNLVLDFQATNPDLKPFPMTIQVGEQKEVGISMIMYTSGTYNAGASFSYSFDVVLAATQA